MDRFGNIGPEKGEYASDVRLVADRLQRGETVYVSLCARSSKLRVFLLLDAPPDGRDPTELEGGTWGFVAVAEHGAYWFRLDSYLAPGYVASKLGLAYGDGETMAEFLTRVGLAMKIGELA